MVLTVTLNPSVDISYRLDKFEIDGVNRCKDYIKTAGGKGLNVARVLNQLGENVTCTGFLGGELGDFIEHTLSSIGIGVDFQRIEGSTRNCIAIIDGQQNQTEILETGPRVTEEEQQAFLQKYETLCKKSKVVTISGSSPKGVENTFVEKLIEIAKNHGSKVVADLSGILLKDLVFNFNTKPDVIKPNLEEFLELIGKKEKDIDVPKELKTFDKGIEMVMVSCSKKGSFLKKDRAVYEIKVPKVKAINPVGSGDSTVAGIALALSEEKDPIHLAKLANALGVSNAMNKETGRVDTDLVPNLMDKITVKKI